MCPCFLFPVFLSFAIPFPPLSRFPFPSLPSSRSTAAPPGGGSSAADGALRRERPAVFLAPPRAESIRAHRSLLLAEEAARARPRHAPVLETETELGMAWIPQKRRRM
ncbi:hypothetical protein PVAP13_5KG388907 [Panicum virgatum]|uniref:Secreted protein n=1 Tax=Panicum virgatum TaxID=38727 RepID=A0A8T0SNZ1_PANVG|nr:hypothetical protein PVAP13_5KG388907 [Panicum virgatum]